MPYKMVGPFIRHIKDFMYLKKNMKTKKKYMMKIIYLRLSKEILCRNCLIVLFILIVQFRIFFSLGIL